MYSDKRNIRGMKRKLNDKDDDQYFNKPKTKFKDDLNDLNSLNCLNNINASLPLVALDQQDLMLDEFSLNSLNKENDELNKENSDLKIDFLNNNFTSSLSSSSINDLFNSTDYLTQNETNETTKDINDHLDNEINNINALDDLNNNLDNQQINNESFNTFLNTSLNNCYESSRPLTPIPQLDTTQNDQINANSLSADQNQPQSSFNSIDDSLDSSTIDHQNSQPSNQLSSSKENLSPLNKFSSLISSNTKLFNSTSSSLFNAAAIVDTYFSSSAKKSKLEKAKNMNHFRYSLFNKSLAKLNKFCNSSDPDIRNSVLVCNTLKRLERQLRKENIFLHLGSNGLAFIKLRNKRNPEQLDYQNLVLDEASQIYVEKNANSNDNVDEDDNQNVDDEFGVDDFCLATQQSSDSDEEDESSESEDDLSENLIGKSSQNELKGKLDYLSSSTYEDQTDNSLVNSSLVDNSLNETITSENLTNEWSNEGETSWNMFTNLTLCRESENGAKFENASLISGQQDQTCTEQKDADEKDDETFGSNYLFNSIEQTVDQSNLNSSNDEIFNDIDSLITLYDFDLSTTSTDNLNSTKLIESSELGKTKDGFNDLKNSSDQDCNESLFTIDSAICLSSNNSINNTINTSLNSSTTSCSSSVSVSSSSTSFSSNQSNNTIPPVIS